MFIAMHFQESVFVFCLEKTDGIDGVTSVYAVFEVNRIKLATFDFRMRAVLVEIFSEIDRLLVQLRRLVENPRHRAIDHIIFQTAVVIEMKELTRSECVQKEFRQYIFYICV